jgi:hypothetical protein
MIDLLTMLTQQVDAVIIAIRGPHDGMDVLARGFIVVECNAALVVELNENDGAVHTVVKRTSASKAIRRIRHRVR